jgi:hypothetical protein
MLVSYACEKLALKLIVRNWTWLLQINRYFEYIIVVSLIMKQHALDLKFNLWYMHVKDKSII